MSLDFSFAPYKIESEMKDKGGRKKEIGEREGGIFQLKK